MKLLVQGILISMMAALLAACAPMTPAPTEQSEPDKPGTSPATEAVTDTERDEPVAGDIRPGERRSGSGNAVAGLMEKGWALYRQDNHEGALVVAERAQRIEPRNPDVYLLMARAQLALYRLAAAEQLARRGLSLAGAGSAMREQFESLLATIQASQ